MIRASRIESERSVSLRQALLTPAFEHQPPSAFSGTTVSPLTPPPTRSVHSLIWSVDFQPVPGFSAITDCASTTAPIHSVRLATNQLHEAIAQHWVILDHDNARLSLALSVCRHGMGRTATSVRSGTRQVTTVLLVRFDCTSHEPPTHWARYRIMRRPIPFEMALVSNPFPLSRTVSNKFS